MKRAIPLSLTVEEAVAEMVNMDYIPDGLTLLEMIAAFEEEAEVDYENACIDRLPEDQLASLKFRMDSCKARHTLAQQLLESLRWEVKNPKNSMIVFADDSSSHQRLTLESVSDWASDKYGIGISRWTIDPNTVATDTVTTDTVDTNTVAEDLKGVRWEDVTIKIWKDYKIWCSYKGKKKRSTFLKIGLMDKRAQDRPNHQGMILKCLSMKNKFPNGSYENKHAVAIWRITNILRDWTGLSDSPFMPYNTFDGWKPRFKLIYDVKNADKRAEEKAWHEPFDDSKAY